MRQQILAKFFNHFFTFAIIGIIFVYLSSQAYAAGNIYGACAGLAQTQAICTDDPCGTGVATNYATMAYNGYTSSGACSQYCCTNVSPTPTPTVTVTPSFTPSPTPSTRIDLTICLHGLGNCGDNVSPNAGGNKNLKHLTRALNLGLFDSSDQQVASITGTLQYSTASAKFTAKLTVPANISAGSYIAKINADGFLTKQVPGITQVTSGQTITIPEVSLVAGNINNDNQVDILDYNLLTDCFGSKQTSPSCTIHPTSTSSGADLNDDGVVDAADYNLFLRELSVQKAN